MELLLKMNRFFINPCYSPVLQVFAHNKGYVSLSIWIKID